MVGNSTFATPETLARMPYLKAWLRETLRLYPVLSAIPRRPKDIILGGYHIPGGTAQVEFLVHQMGRDESISEDAEAFKPERWLRNRYRFDRISRSFRFSFIWIRNTYVPRSTYCRVRAPSADDQNRAAV